MMTTAAGVPSARKATEVQKEAFLQDLTSLQESALAWFEANGRDLAFRHSADPWSVLVSEVMAQQTQAERAAEAWSVFIDRYPTPAALAAASQADVIRAWRGLGYNRRAVALRAAAIRIVEEHRGDVPDTLEQLQALPGIGPYTARAVLAIAFGRPVAALDTNIARVLERSAGGLPMSRGERQSAADAFVPAARSAAWTHALMDIGSTFCHKRAPSCRACPLTGGCAFAYAGSRTVPAARAVERRPIRFASTNRWLRGRIIDRLRDASAGPSPDAWVAFDESIGEHDLAAVQAALAGLDRDGMLERDPAEPGRARLHA